MKVVVWDQNYQDSDVPVAGYCTDEANIGATSHQTPASVITLCPASFGASNVGLFPEIRGIRAVEAKPVPNGDLKKSKTSAQPVSDLYPTAATLFHELFHLILGNEETVLPGGASDEEYSVARILRLGYKASVRNPETFTVASLAYDYTSKIDADSSGKRLEFIAGYTTRG